MNLRRYSTSLAEVQDAVAQIRTWLDAGTDMNEIAVLAPDIEAYWPSLARYLDVEGIPCRKERLVVAASYPSVQVAINRLKAETGQWTRAIVETLTFTNEIQMTYGDFEKRFQNFYGPHQIKSIPWLPSLFSNQHISSLEFCDHVVSSNGTNLHVAIEVVLQKMVEDSGSGLKLSFAAWVRYFELMAARTEILDRPGASQGIQALSLTSIGWLAAKHIWVMGLTEENLKTFEASGLTMAETLSLGAQLGFALPAPDRNQKEVEARWLLDRRGLDIYLSTAATDFMGSAQAASLLWLKASIDQHISHDLLQVPGETRMREIQQTYENQPVSWQKYAPVGTLQLSASQIERYLKCPFMFAAERVFRLKAEPPLDLDMDAMTKGLIQHALFEILSTEPMRFDWTIDELATVVESLKDRAQMGEQAFWPVFKQKYIQMGRQFVEFERQWREQFPQNQILARELSFEGVWNLDEHRFMPSGPGVVMKGRIDRVDGDANGHLIVIDYKSSGARYHHWQKWLEHGELQMALYACALEDGITALKTSKVVGAFYYVLKDTNRATGFRLRGPYDHLIDAQNKSRNWLTDDEKMMMLGELRKLVSQIIIEIQSGEFQPKPRDVKDCDPCRWRTMCRAPHLN